VAAIGAGAHYEVAAHAAGVSRSTFYRWRQRGQEEEVGALRDFVAELERAEAAAELRFVANIARAGELEWRAAAWLLARRSPSRWGRSTFEPTPQSPSAEAGSGAQRGAERDLDPRELPQALLDALEGHYDAGE